MWQFWGTLAVSALGGSFVIHYLKNFLLEEKLPFGWDWDGMAERLLITYLITAAQQWLYIIPAVIGLKVVLRLILIGFAGSLFKRSEPGVASQKVTLKAELAFDLILSPAIAILVGVLF
jgi:hypothetical protein